MEQFFRNVLAASFHGSIVILAVLVLRLLLRKAPKKYLYYLWLLSGIRLLMPFEIQSELSLQPVDLPEIGSIAAVVPVLWALVAGGFLVYSTCSYWKLRRRVGEAVKIPGGWESGGIDTAFILGFMKPKIYIPVGINPETRKHILAHEQTHLDKGDHWVKMIGFLALGLHWFNPLVWVAYILLCKDIEMACDERVVQFMELQERKEYSTALLQCSSRRIHYAASPVAFGEVSVKNRIVTILNYRKPSFWLGLLSVLAIGFVSVCLVTSPTEPPVVIEAQYTEPTEETAPPAETAPPPREPVSDWGLHMIAEVGSPTTMTLYVGVDVAGIPWDGTPIEKDHPYWIEKWDGESWEPLPLLVEAPGYEGSYGTEFSKDNYHRAYMSNELDWTLLYGVLPEGDYRIGIRPTRNGEKKPHYAQFHIWANALTGENAQAIERCEAALDRLLGQDSYSVTVSQTNAFGNLKPVRTYVKSQQKARIDSYVGDLCYNSFYCEASDYRMAGWESPFRLKENKGIAFTQSSTEQEVVFTTSWEDVQGLYYEQENCYRFAADGRLEQAQRVTRYQNETGAEITEEVSMKVEKTAFGDTVNPLQLPKNSIDSAEDSPWGIFFRVDDDYLSPTGGSVWFSTGDTVGIIDYTTDSTYWLEKKNGDHWEKLECLAGEPKWGDQTYRLSSRTTSIDWVDWGQFYGEVEPGLYRMGKRFYNGEDSIIQYSEFLVYPQGGRIGGTEDDMARLDAAVEAIRSGNYHIVCESNGSYGVPPMIDMVFWKYDGICVTDYYDFHRGEGYQHSVVDADPRDDLFYDYFLNYLNWNEPRYQVFFADGASRISEEEMTFAVALTGNDTMKDLMWYSVFFDDEGNIEKIEYYGTDFTGNRRTILTVRDTSDEEIAAWVDKIRSQET